MSELIEQVARNQFSLVQQDEMSWLVKWRGEVEDEFACLKDAEDWITFAVANVSAALRELSAKLDTRWEDWRKQLLDAWAKDHRATMTALLEGGPVAPQETTND